MKPRQMCLSVLVIAVIVVFPHLGLIPFFSYTLPVLLCVWFALRTTGEGFSDVGFRFRSCSRKAALVGTLSAFIILGVMQLLVFPTLELFIEFEPKEVGLYDFIRASPAQFAIMIAMGWLVGGLYEEIVLHGFIFTRLEKMIPGKCATAVSFVLTAGIFGAYHLQLGSAGAFNALVVGAVYLALFLRFERNLWAAIICHGVYNTLVMTLIYLGHL